MGTYLLVVVVLVGGLILFAYFVRFVGCNCHKCGGRMTTWSRLSSDEQNEIARYFHERERRSPDTKALFVCRRCGFVYDDFSGERESMEGDETGYCKVCGEIGVRYLNAFSEGERRAAAQQNPGLVPQHECLRCEPVLAKERCVMCGTERKLLGCRKCLTLYEWQTPSGSRFRFFVPLTDKPLCEKPGKTVLVDT